MHFTGKRTDRIRLPKQLRFPTDLALRIRASAQLNNRPIESQILHFVIQGIRFEEQRNGDVVTSGHTQSQGVTR